MLATGKHFLDGRLLLNLTPSIPRGVYWISPRETLGRGDLVTFPIPASVQHLMHAREYVPAEVKLLSKPVIATGGEHVCVRYHELFVNGHAAGKILTTDREGRAMPQYFGCGVLARNEVFVATSHDNSFDSRYFGPIDVAVIRGTLSPLLTF